MSSDTFFKLAPRTWQLGLGEKAHFNASKRLAVPTESLWGFRSVRLVAHCVGKKRTRVSSRWHHRVVSGGKWEICKFQAKHSSFPGLSVMLERWDLACPQVHHQIGATLDSLFSISSCERGKLLFPKSGTFYVFSHVKRLGARLRSSWVLKSGGLASLRGEQDKV